MPTLVVVDMQKHFKASQTGWMIEHVSREIRASMQAGHAIVFLEYTRNAGPAGVAVKGMTDRRLIDIVAEYDIAVVAHKPGVDGSEQVVAVLDVLNHERGYGIGQYDDVIRVVGVETGVCVAQTVNGLAEKRPGTRIVVVGDACNIQKDGVAGAQPGNEGQGRIDERGNVSVLKVDGVTAL